MSWRRFRRVLLFGLLVAFALKAVRSLRGPDSPAFTRHPSAWDGRTQQPASTATATPSPTPPAAPSSALPEPPPETQNRLWAEPVDDSCPPGYPVKAKERSGIYHEPGMLAYERTKPDRCYASAADALADGFRAAKR